jgi:hypothetical protein
MAQGTGPSKEVGPGEGGALWLGSKQSEPALAPLFPVPCALFPITVLYNTPTRCFSRPFTSASTQNEMASRMAARVSARFRLRSKPR